MSVETVLETLQGTADDGIILKPLINTLVAIIILIGVYDWWYRYKAPDNRTGIQQNTPTPQEVPIIGLNHLAAGLTDAEITSIRGRR